METNAQNNITNDVKETTGTYKDLEKTEPVGNRLGTWGSIWGILKDQVELIAYIDERISELINTNAITNVATIENTDIDKIINKKEENTETNTTEETNITTQQAKTVKKKRIVVIS